MISEELEFRIAQYADGSLPAAEVAELEAALAADAEARALLEEYRKLDTILKAEAPALPNVRWDRLADHISKAVDDEDRATTTYTITSWWVRSAAVAAVVAIAFGVVALWPRGNGNIAQNDPNDHPTAVALIEVGGPETSSKPAVEEISVEPSALAEAGNYRIAEDIVYRPSRVIIASDDQNRQDSSRLPY
jgi:anti-sigma-K factor RskA